MADEQVIPMAPGIFVDGNPVFAAERKGAKWGLLYLSGTRVFSTEGQYKVPPKNEVTLTGAWEPPAKTNPSPVFPLSPVRD